MSASEAAVAVMLLLAAGAAALAADRLLRHSWFPVVALIGLYLLGTVDGIVGTVIDSGTGNNVPLFGQLSTLLALVVSVLVMARPHRDPPGTVLWAGMVAYAGTLTFVDLLHGAPPDQGIVMMVLVGTALWVAPRLDSALVLDVAKVVIGSGVLASGVTWLIGLDGASDGYSSPFFPLADFRLTGIYTHANSLGPIALLYPILEYARPSIPRIRIPMVVLSGALLLFSQSKTSWGAALVAVVALAVANQRRRRAAQILAVVVGAMVVSLAWVGVEFADVVAGEEIEDVTTLTGRTDLWATGFDAWQRSDPLIGTGPGFFEANAEETGQEWAGQAHNQWVQTLTEQGVVGVLGLAAYVVALLSFGWRHAPATRHASLAIVLTLVLSTMTETELDGFSRQHLVTFAALMAWERDRVLARGPYSSEAAPPPEESPVATRS